MDLVVVLWQHSLEESVKNVNSNTNAVVEIIATIIIPAHRLHKTTVLHFLMTGKRQYSGPWFGRSFCKPRLLLADRRMDAFQGFQGQVSVKQRMTLCSIRDIHGWVHYMGLELPK